MSLMLVENILIVRFVSLYFRFAPESPQNICLLWKNYFTNTVSISKLSSKTNISKFQFHLDYRQAFYHEPLARVIAQALPVFDVEFTFALLYIYM